MSNTIKLQAACCLVVAVLFSHTPHAQVTAKTGALSLRDAVGAAWTRSARLPAAAGRLGIAHANKTAAEALWAASPSMEVAHRGDPALSASGQRETEIGVAWPLLLPGQRSAKNASAEADLGIAQAMHRAGLLSVAGEVREAAWAVYGLRADLAIAEAHSSAIEALAVDVERRVAAGDLARADALVARAEALAASAAVSSERQRLAGAMSRWTLLTGLQEVPEGNEVRTGGMPDDHPELVLERHRADGARKRLELVRLSRRAPPEVIVRIRHESPGSSRPAQDTVGVVLRIPFATDDRNLPLEAAALAEENIALTEGRRTRERLDSELALARAQESAAESQVALEQARHALLAERARLVDKSFRAGETALPELLRTLAAAAQAERTLARQRSDLGLARARVQQAAGQLP